MGYKKITGNDLSNIDWTTYINDIIENALWRERARDILTEEFPDDDYEMIDYFVNDFWQNLTFDETNIKAYKLYRKFN